MQLVSKITLATFDFNKHFRIKWLSHVASCNIGKYFPRFSYFAIICKIWETWGKCSILHSAPLDKNYIYRQCEIYNRNKTSYNMNIKHIIKISILATFQQPQVTGKACSGFFWYSFLVFNGKKPIPKSV